MREQKKDNLEIFFFNSNEDLGEEAGEETRPPEGEKSE